MEGFVTLSRSFFSHDLWKEERSFSRAEAWVDLVQSAAFADSRRLISGNFVEVPRGGIVASVRFLSDRWKWSKTKVCLFLDQLETETMISRQKGQLATVILLCNFEKYNQKKGQEAGRKKDTGETPSGHPKDKDNKDNKGNNDSASTQTDKPFWSKADGWSNVDSLRDDFAKAYPACNFDLQLSRATDWLKSNPAKATKSNWRRFLTNWFGRCQDRGGDGKGAGRPVSAQSWAPPDRNTIDAATFNEWAKDYPNAPTLETADAKWLRAFTERDAE